MCPEIYHMCLKIFRLVQISLVGPEVSSMCPETLIVQTVVRKYSLCVQFFNYIYIYIYIYIIHQKFKLLKKLRRVSGNFSHKDNIIFYHMTQKSPGLLKNSQISMLPCYRGFSLSA